MFQSKLLIHLQKVLTKKRRPILLRRKWRKMVSIYVRKRQHELKHYSLLKARWMVFSRQLCLQNKVQEMLVFRKNLFQTKWKELLHQFVIRIFQIHQLSLQFGTVNTLSSTKSIFFKWKKKWFCLQCWLSISSHLTFKNRIQLCVQLQKWDSMVFKYVRNCSWKKIQSFKKDFRGNSSEIVVPISSPSYKFALHCDSFDVHNQAPKYLQRNEDPVYPSTNFTFHNDSSFVPNITPNHFQRNAEKNSSFI